jgi:RNA polymerase sigma-70 factor, ECF subfamily
VTEPAGNETSLDQLVEQHLPGALRFAVSLTGDPGTAEEILQDALVRVARGWKGFRNEASFRTWLYRIVINVFRSHVAKTSPVGRLTDDPVDAAAIDPADASQLAELKRLVAAKVSALPPRQREVFVLLTYEGLTVEEAAETLGITPANVHSTLHVARTRLREQLAPFLAEQPDE